jgi:hypothetical protein
VERLKVNKQRAVGFTLFGNYGKVEVKGENDTFSQHCFIGIRRKQSKAKHKYKSERGSYTLIKFVVSSLLVPMYASLLLVVSLQLHRPPFLLAPSYNKQEVKEKFPLRLQMSIARRKMRRRWKVRES